MLEGLDGGLFWVVGVGFGEGDGVGGFVMRLGLDCVVVVGVGFLEW